MDTKKHNSGLTLIEREYLKALKPQLQDAIRDGEPERAAAFAKEIARLRRKQNRAKGGSRG